MTLDHIGYNLRDFGHSKVFYEKALARSRPPSWSKATGGR
jgi:hypothetical protein